MRSWSPGARRTAKRLGTRMRSRETTAAFVSSSRRRAAVTSRGCRPLLKVLANAPLTTRSKPFSKLSRIPKKVSSPMARWTRKRSRWNITMLVGQPPKAEGTAPHDDSGSLAELTAPAVLARVAELADALASGASARKGVGVQVPPRARESASPLGPGRFSLLLARPSDAADDPLCRRRNFCAFDVTSAPSPDITE